MKKKLYIFSKPEQEPFQRGSVEAQVSNIRLETIARGVNDLQQAFIDMGAEDPAKALQNEKAAELFQGAVNLVRQDERTAAVVEAVTQSKVVPNPEMSATSQNSVSQHVPTEVNAQPLQGYTSGSKEAQVADAQASVAAALLNVEQKK